MAGPGRAGQGDGAIIETIMDTFRHLVALLLVTLVPAVLLYWLLLHALLPVWRRLGLAASQYLLWAAVLAAAVFLHAWRDTLPWTDHGWQPILAAAGIVCLAGAIIFRLQIGRFLPWRVQLGWPEIDPQGYPQKLVDEGPYAHTRHPRYLQILLALAGWALVANYPAGYLAALLWIPLMLVIVRLEEAELHRRFGGAYRDYCARVARFWPHEPAAQHRVKA
jgi:protein-S-isoprenylcysteine O-methyltransferase Ste14